MNRSFRRFVPAVTGRSRFLSEVILIFTAIVLVLFGLFHIQTSREIQSMRESVETSDFLTVEFQKEYLENEVQLVKDDLEFISRMKAFNDLIEGQDALGGALVSPTTPVTQKLGATPKDRPAGPDGKVPPDRPIGGQGRDIPFERLEEVPESELMRRGAINDPVEILQRDIGFYISISDRYEEIIYADENGMEVFNLSRIDGKLYQVPKLMLADISDRDFYGETMSLGEGEVYQSPMKRVLIEGVEQNKPRPRIRVGVKVLNLEGEEKGVLAISYNTSLLLRDFERIGASTEGNNYLLNAQGEVLAGSINKQFLKVTEERDAWPVFDKPDVLEMVLAGGSEESVQQEYFDWGLTTMVPIGDQSNFDNDSQWYAVSTVLEEASPFFTSESEFKLIVTEFLKLWPIGIPLLIISWGVAVIISYRRKFIQDITEMAQIDSMTGAFNRNAGIAMLTSSLKYAIGSNRPFSICFVDVNDLKMVNDEMGHEMGDAYLKDAVKVLKKGFRESDHLIRLGGDEFVIGIQGDADIVEKNWSKVLEAVESFNGHEESPYSISLSHGVATAHEAKDHSIDDLIALADERMYEEKKRIKAARA